MWQSITTWWSAAFVFAVAGGFPFGLTFMA